MGSTEVDYIRTVPETGCWQWIRGGFGHEGYGAVWDRKKKKTVKAHRYVYEMLVGPIPEGLTLDHLCRNRRCVRPAHLEPVTWSENIRRGEMPNMIVRRTGICRRGHSDMAQWKNQRRCRVCAREKGRVAMRRLRQRQRVSA